MAALVARVASSWAAVALSYCETLKIEAFKN